MPERERPGRGGYPAGDMEAGALPSPPEGVTKRTLSPDEIRALLRECVTVVRPGETLIVRAGREWTPVQVREVQDMLDWATEDRHLPFKALIVPGDGLGVAEAGLPGFLADCRIESGFDDAGTHYGVKITHLPSGASFTKPTYEEAVIALGALLIANGKIAINAARGAHGLPPLETQEPGVTHACPPEGGSVTPCCGQNPYGLPRTGRMTLNPELVTCKGAGDA